jgi:tRNA A-37 threonylcarbamoyl transferase component Bud32
VSVIVIFVSITTENLYFDRTQRLFAKAVEMHSVGVRHNDLVPRNVVQDSDGELRIIDFHVAKMRHRCSGKDKCKELLELSDALGL